MRADAYRRIRRQFSFDETGKRGNEIGLTIQRRYATVLFYSHFFCHTTIENIQFVECLDMLRYKAHRNQKHLRYALGSEFANGCIG